MWKDKGLQLVILPTTNNSTIVKSKRDGNVVYHPSVTIGWSCFQSSHWESQYLYLLSEGKIEEEDNYLDDCNDIRKAVTSVKEYWSNRSSYKKIISSTDPSLNLPQFPNTFIEEYVNRYNSKKSLEVEVEYMSNFISSNKGKIKFEELNTNDNTISIRFKEEKKPCTHEVVAEAMRIVSKDVRSPKVLVRRERMYSRSEVEELLDDALNAALQPDDIFFKKYKSNEDYISKNLK